MATNITQEHRAVFEALTSGKYDNFALLSCFVNGEPASAIVTVTRDASGDYTITPLFVSVTPAMTLADHDGTLASSPSTASPPPPSTEREP